MSKIKVILWVDGGELHPTRPFTSSRYYLRAEQETKLDLRQGKEFGNPGPFFPVHMGQNRLAEGDS